MTAQDFMQLFDSVLEQRGQGEFPIYGCRDLLREVDLHGLEHDQSKVREYLCDSCIRAKSGYPRDGEVEEIRNGLKHILGISDNQGLSIRDRFARPQ